MLLKSLLKLFVKVICTSIFIKIQLFKSYYIMLLEIHQEWKYSYINTYKNYTKSRLLNKYVKIRNDETHRINSLLGIIYFLKIIEASSSFIYYLLSFIHYQRRRSRMQKM